MRTEQEIRDKIQALQNMEQRFTRSVYAEEIGAPNNMITREDYTKSVLRAQIKGLKFALGEEAGYSIPGSD
jgi:hypothetical protein